MNKGDFAEDDKHSISSSLGGTIMIWKVDGIRISHTLVAHTRGVWCAIFSPSGRMIVSGSADCTVRIWDTANPVCSSKRDQMDQNDEVDRPGVRVLRCPREEVCCATVLDDINLVAAER